MTPRRFIAALAIAGAGLVACSNGDAAEPAQGPSSGEVVRCSSFDEDCTEVLAPDTVELRGVLFRPDELAVSAGSTVTFTNRDQIDHTVTAGNKDDVQADRFDLVLAEEGDSVTVTFDEPGSYDYFCRIHPSTMIGVIVVS